MRVKLVVLSVICLVIAWIKPATHISWLENPRAAAVSLLPAQSGEFYLSRVRWKNYRPSGLIEEGAWYVRSASPTASLLHPVQLDFYRQAPAEHNALYCFLIQGETLVSSQSLQWQDHGHSIEAVLALTRTAAHSRWMLVTECLSDRCSEKGIHLSLSFGLSGWDPLQGLTQAASARVVPVSMSILAQTNAENRTAIEAQMRADLLSFAQSFDFSASRTLASLSAQTP
jgi:hypothetical protein